MTAAARLLVFAAAVALSFGGAMALGAAVGPIDVGGTNHPGHQPTPTPVTTHHQPGH